MSIEEAYAYCEDVTTAQARNFSYGIKLLPGPKRRAMCAIYALARRIDDIGDGDDSGPDKLAALADARKDVAALAAGSYRGHDPVLTALADVRRRFSIPLSAFDDLIEGCEMDVHGAGYDTIDDLVGYCRRVAGSIGRLSLAVYGTDRPDQAEPRADALGVALQLTNILRDIVEDRDVMGRCYLPAADRARFGVAADLRGPTDAVLALITFEAGQAETWFDRGLELLPMLDWRSRACTAAMAGIYRRLLVRIQTNPAGVLRGRISLSGPEKAAVALPRSGPGHGVTPAPPPGRGRDVVVVGGGLAGLAAALDCADRGARVTVLERRSRLGGLTWSFRHGGRWVDNGQHVFLRCCAAYLSFLERIGAAADVVLPERLDIPVVAPPVGPDGRARWGRLRRSDLPAPLHLAGSLLRYPHLTPRERLGLGRAVWSLRGLDLGDPALDQQSFGAWLARHGQSTGAVAALWDLITVPTVNLPASEASLAMAAKVFQTGLLTDRGAADMGWSRVPLGQLHGDRAAAALARAGAEVHLGARVECIEPRSRPGGPGGFAVRTANGTLTADAVICALPHDVVGTILPPGSIAYQDRLEELGMSAIVDVHLVFDRRVTRWPLLAGLHSPVQWVFDRTESSGMAGGTSPGPGSASAPVASQYVAVSVSAADDLLGRRPDDLVPWITAELGRLLPEAGRARVLDSLVTKERNATFRARPGTAALRPGPTTAWPGLAVAGAWTDTGWPATMEGAVRSGRAAAAACLTAHPDFEYPDTEEVA